MPFRNVYDTRLRSAWPGTYFFCRTPCPFSIFTSPGLPAPSTPADLYPLSSNLGFGPGIRLIRKLDHTARASAVASPSGRWFASSSGLLVCPSRCCRNHRRRYNQYNIPDHHQAGCIRTRASSRHASRRLCRLTIQRRFLLLTPQTRSYRNSTRLLILTPAIVRAPRIRTTYPITLRNQVRTAAQTRPVTTPLAKCRS
jgi:hypothetical protein